MKIEDISLQQLEELNNFDKSSMKAQKYISTLTISQLQELAKVMYSPRVLSSK